MHLEALSFSNSFGRDYPPPPARAAEPSSAVPWIGARLRLDVLTGIHQIKGHSSLQGSLSWARRQRIQPNFPSVKKADYHPANNAKQILLLRGPPLMFLCTVCVCNEVLGLLSTYTSHNCMGVFLQYALIRYTCLWQYTCLCEHTCLWQYGNSSKRITSSVDLCGGLVSVGLFFVAVCYFFHNSLIITDCKIRQPIDSCWFLAGWHWVTVNCHLCFAVS